MQHSSGLVRIQPLFHAKGRALRCYPVSSMQCHGVLTPCMAAGRRAVGRRRSKAACTPKQYHRVHWYQVLGKLKELQLFGGPFHELDEGLVAKNRLTVAEAFQRVQKGRANQQCGSAKLTSASLNEIVASIMGTAAAVVRLNLLSGTHAIAAALFACLRPGDELLLACGAPYDTLEEVIGSRRTPHGGSLADWGVCCRVHPLKPDGSVDLHGLSQIVRPGTTRVCHIQRSCGYSLRPTLTIHEVAQIVDVVKARDSSIIVTVDNCYGEFTETKEPGHVDADLVMGSLIKSPGGTLATGGGYIAGKPKLVEAAATWFLGPQPLLESPSLTPRLHHLLQGLWLAPVLVGEALKGGMVVACTMRALGFKVWPVENTLERPSYITAIELGSAAAMVAFCKTLQQFSPVGAYVIPEPGRTPGYQDPVIFADGTFVDGSTSELSADGPIREPYTVYCQGGVHWTQWAYVLEKVVERITEACPD